MITRCPYCLTHFRIHPEQLSARAGRVRCGKCTRVFDASEHLIAEAAAAGEPLAPQPAAASSAPAEPLLATGSAPERALESESTPAEPTPTLAIPDGARIGAETAQADAGEFDEATADPGISRAAGVQTEAGSGANAFDFGPQPPVDPSSRGRRWPWLLGSLLLLLVLLAQAAYFYRSTLIVLFPQAKPYAAELCANLGCELPLPRRIELMSIEASDLQADTANPSVMVLSATLKNRALFNQQLPMLELTLTDVQDQPVVRRVLAPQDYAGKAAELQTGFAANTEIAIKVFIEASQVKATGYRLYLFYP